jgi:hypothetical protein
LGDNREKGKRRKAKVKRQKEKGNRRKEKGERQKEKGTVRGYKEEGVLMHPSFHFRCSDRYLLEALPD